MIFYDIKYISVLPIDDLISDSIRDNECKCLTDVKVRLVYVIYIYIYTVPSICIGEPQNHRLDLSCTSDA